MDWTRTLCWDLCRTTYSTNDCNQSGRRSTEVEPRSSSAAKCLRIEKASFPVTFMANPPEDASFVTHEIFGPIRSVFKVHDCGRSDSSCQQHFVWAWGFSLGEEFRRTQTSSPPT